MEIITGNELLSGGTVYLDAQGQWVENLQSARLFDKSEIEARDAVIAASKATGRIISLEVEEVSLERGQIVPKRLRERIRARGPTAPLNPTGEIYDRQHLSEDGHVSL